MIIIELENQMEYYEKNISHHEEVLLYLAVNFPNEFAETINFLKEFLEETYGSPNILEAMSLSSLIDEIDEHIDEEILINYVVKGSRKTAMETNEFIVENGYGIIKKED